VIEDGDLEPRSDMLSWLADKLELRIKSSPLCRDGYGLFVYKDSRAILYEDQAKTKEQKAAREAALKDKKIPPEVFDQSFAETPKAFYIQLGQELEACLTAVSLLDETCRSKFADVAPSFGRLQSGLEEIRHTVHGFLQKKRETESDLVDEPTRPAPQSVVQAAAEPAPVAVTAGASGSAAAAVAMAPVAFTEPTVPLAQVAEPADRREAMAAIAAAAAFLRRREPFSPAPYLMLRGLRWGELRASRDPAVLEAPPTDVRRRIKALALERNWSALLEAAENMMGTSYGRAWLDLQRFVVEACVELGAGYEAIAMAVRSELRALLRDLPQLAEATLTDDTPAANPQTQAWLRDILAEPAAPAPAPDAPRLPVFENHAEPGWQRKLVDPQVLANDAMQQGQPQKAVEILHREIERQRSGRGRFQRKLQLAQICITAGKDAIAQPLLDELAGLVETHRLEEWEERETMAAALLFLMQSSKKIQGDAKLKQAMFERICRLDPVQALSV
jgi:type VI secretion system protein ImpA